MGGSNGDIGGVSAGLEFGLPLQVLADGSFTKSLALSKLGSNHSHLADEKA